MYLFFEEAGDFKAGTVLKKDGANYQVELTTGRRCKVKANHVFFEFESPSAATFLTQAQETAAEMDPMFLWEVAPEEEFGYESIAADYFSSVTAVEKGAALIALHSNPVYFYRLPLGRSPATQKRRVAPSGNPPFRLAERTNTWPSGYV